MNKPIDPQQEIILASLYRSLSEHPEMIKLFGDQPSPIVSRLLRFDPVDVKVKEQRVDIKVEPSGIPCLCVYTDGDFSYEGEGMEQVFSRKFSAEYIGTLPAATADLTAGEHGYVAGTAVGAIITKMMLDSETLNNVEFGHLPICSKWITDITVSGGVPYVLPLHNIFGVDVSMTVRHSEYYPPYLTVETSLPLQQVDTDMTYAAPGGDLEHDSEHEITQ